MRLSLCCFLVLALGMTIWLSLAEAQTAFEREVERFQRKRFSRILDDLERGIQIRIEEIELEEVEAEEELEKEEAPEEEKEEEEVEEGKRIEITPRPKKPVEKKIEPEEYVKALIDLQMDLEPEDSPWQFEGEVNIAMKRDSNTFFRAH